MSSLTSHFASRFNFRPMRKPPSETSLSHSSLLNNLKLQEGISWDTSFPVLVSMTLNLKESTKASLFRKVIIWDLWYFKYGHRREAFRISEA